MTPTLRIRFYRQLLDKALAQVEHERAVDGKPDSWSTWRAAVARKRYDDAVARERARHAVGGAA